MTNWGLADMAYATTTRSKPSYSPTAAAVRSLVSHLGKDAVAFDLLYRVLSDLDPTLCCHIPPPPAVEARTPLPTPFTPKQPKRQAQPEQRGWLDDDMDTDATASFFGMRR
jgi:hypothetical protein